MSDTPIFEETVAASGRPFPAKIPVPAFGWRYWKRREKKAKALTERVWKEINEQWNATR